MITMKANLKTGKLQAFDAVVGISCIVRNETNSRGKSEVVFSMPDEKPFQPRTFPIGTWEVHKPVARDSAYLKPFFIPTSAYQELPIWELDNLGNYKVPTEVMTRDIGYGLHHSSSRTTLGCIKILKLSDLLWIVDMINRALDAGQRVVLEVV